MSSLEFPGNNNTNRQVNQNTSSNATQQKNDEKSEKRFQKLTKILEGINKNVSTGFDKVGSQVGDVTDDLVNQVFGSGLLVNKIKDGATSLVKGIKSTLFKSVGGIINFMKIDKNTRHFKIAKMLVRLKHGITAPFKLMNKTLKKIGEGITWLSEKGISGLGKTLKYILIGAGIFIKWLKGFLMKSFIFKALGKIGSLAWEGIKGVVSIGGELASSIASALMGYGAGSALATGIKGMTAGMTAAKFMPILAGALAAALVGYGIYKLADFLSDTPPDPDEALLDTQKNINELYNQRVKGKISQEKFEKELEKLNLQKAGYTYMKGEKDVSLDTDNENVYKAKYDQWIKEYPETMKDLVGSNWFQKYITGGDKDKNDYLDYTPELYNRAANVIEKGNMSGFIRSQAAIEELKNKAVLKNTAGVTST